MTGSTQVEVISEEATVVVQLIGDRHVGNFRQLCGRLDLSVDGLLERLLGERVQFTHGPVPAVSRSRSAPAATAKAQARRRSGNLTEGRILTMAQPKQGDLLFFASEMDDPRTIFHDVMSLAGDK